MEIMNCWRLNCFLSPAFLILLAMRTVSFAQQSADTTEGTVRAETAAGPRPAAADGGEEAAARLTLDQLKAEGARRSAWLRQQAPASKSAAPKPRTEIFRQDIEPVLKQACVSCHGPDVQEGNIRIDTLDPDLHHGQDVTWWLEVFAVLSKGEMPPPQDSELRDDDRGRIIDWLSQEIQSASEVRRAEEQHSSFRRMTKYEYNYALQDLLGLPFDFARDLPPDASAEGGFQNSSEMLHMSTLQFATYRELARSALKKATVRGERPAELYWGVSMQAASASAWAQQNAELEKLRETYRNDPDKLHQELQQRLAGYQVRHNRTHYKDISTGRTAVVEWSYPQAKYAWAPADIRPNVPDPANFVAIIPPRQHLIVELGDRIPESGTLRVRARVARLESEDGHRFPSLQLEFGWQASNDSQASVRISDRDFPVAATPADPEFLQWDVPLSEIYPRNLVRNVSMMGDLPSPSEYIRFVNSSVSQGDIQIDYVEVTAPVYDQWPPDSHRRIFGESDRQSHEAAHAAQILSDFMPRAWRRPVTQSELEQKLTLCERIRPECDDFPEALVEVLSTVLSSPKFLYLVQTDAAMSDGRLSQYDLATRLSMFLWCSTPDQELVELAGQGRLNDAAVLAAQVDRLLSDERSGRFSREFVRQWLGMQLFEYLKIDRKEYPQFDPSLKEAMQEEPVAFFHEVLQHNQSVMDLLHADYTMANERLARHYGLNGVLGNEFRRVPLEPQSRRGGLLTQAGLLAMNSDGKDSHPLKRGIWLLERILNDPPPPPPPAVPRIDLADPEIAKLTLKKRLENHRDQAACRSCHMKIDPWGIAFENFDATGSWRTEVRGQPVDASSVLSNNQELNGVDGLKRYLLEHRQDQFVSAIAHKMTAFALGRPLTFADRAGVDQIAADLRRSGDGLATLVKAIVLSDLFQAL